jgi:hypothetical protein
VQDWTAAPRLRGDKLRGGDGRKATREPMRLSVIPAHARPRGNGGGNPWAPALFDCVWNLESTKSAQSADSPLGAMSAPSAWNSSRKHGITVIPDAIPLRRAKEPVGGHPGGAAAL